MKTTELIEGLTTVNGQRVGIFYYKTDFTISDEQCRDLGPEIKAKCKVSGWRGDVKLEWYEDKSALAKTTDDSETLELLRKRTKPKGTARAEVVATGNARNDAAMSKFIHEFLQEKFPNGNVKRVS